MEFTREFVEPDWCKKGHIGFVLRGEFEVDFGGQREISSGSGIFIAADPNNGHKARAVTPTVRLFLGRPLVVSHTERGERVRIISARLAKKGERKIYEEG